MDRLDECSAQLLSRRRQRLPDLPARESELALLSARAARGEDVSHEAAALLARLKQAAKSSRGAPALFDLSRLLHQDGACTDCGIGVCVRHSCGVCKPKSRRCEHLVVFHSGRAPLLVTSKSHVEFTDAGLPLLRTEPFEGPAPAAAPAGPACEVQFADGSTDRGVFSCVRCLRGGLEYRAAVAATPGRASTTGGLAGAARASVRFAVFSASAPAAPPCGGKRAHAEAEPEPLAGERGGKRARRMELRRPPPFSAAIVASGLEPIALASPSTSSTSSSSSSAEEEEEQEEEDMLDWDCVASPGPETQPMSESDDDEQLARFADSVLSDLLQADEKVTPISDFDLDFNDATHDHGSVMCGLGLCGGHCLCDPATTELCELQLCDTAGLCVATSF